MEKNQARASFPSADWPSGPLNGLRVIELAGIGPVPFAGMVLADMGAEILRITAPPDKNSFMLIPEAEDPINRGRARLMLDLKNAADRDRLAELCKYADVLLEGFRPGVLERLGLDPEFLLSENPALIIGRMTGFGQDGPLAQTPGHDANYIALTGALHAIGETDGPPIAPLNLLGDYGGGAMVLIAGVLAALLNVKRTGKGQIIDCAMTDGAAMLMSPIYALLNRGIWRDARGENILDGAAPFARLYETKDGKHVAVCAAEPQFYQALLMGLGLDQEILPNQYDARAWPSMREKFAALFKTKTRDEWCESLERGNACVSPVLSLTEAPSHPHNKARRTFSGEDKPAPAPAPRFSATPSGYAPMDLGDPNALIAAWRSMKPAT